MASRAEIAGQSLRKSVTSDIIQLCLWHRACVQGSAVPLLQGHWTPTSHTSSSTQFCTALRPSLMASWNVKENVAVCASDCRTEPGLVASTLPAVKTGCEPWSNRQQGIQPPERVRKSQSFICAMAWSVEPWMRTVQLWGCFTSNGHLCHEATRSDLRALWHQLRASPLRWRWTYHPGIAGRCKLLSK